jgi:hypothetical protein
MQICNALQQLQHELLDFAHAERLAPVRHKQTRMRLEVQQQDWQVL